MARHTIGVTAPVPTVRPGTIGEVGSGPEIRTLTDAIRSARPTALRDNPQPFFPGEAPATESGTYYVSAGSVGRGTGTYTLSVRDADDDFLASTRTGGTATVGGSVTGEVETDTDRDWFAVDLTAGKVYRFDLEGSSTNAGTLYDPVLWGIHDSNGDTVAGTFADGGGTGHNGRLFFTPTASGTYYVDAGAWAASGQTGTYKLSVTGDDFAAGTGTTGAVTVDTIDWTGVRNTGKVDHAGDRDWFAVELVAGTSYRIDMEGQATGAGTLPDPYLNGIYSSTGGFIGRTLQPGNRDGGVGNNARITFTPTESGTHYISAGDAGANASNLGTYTLSVEEVL